MMEPIGYRTKPPSVLPLSLAFRFFHHRSHPFAYDVLLFWFPSFFFVVSFRRKAVIHLSDRLFPRASGHPVPNPNSSLRNTISNYRQGLATLKPSFCPLYHLRLTVFFPLSPNHQQSLFPSPPSIFVPRGLLRLVFACFLSPKLLPAQIRLCMVIFLLSSHIYFSPCDISVERNPDESAVVQQISRPIWPKDVSSDANAHLWPCLHCLKCWWYLPTSCRSAPSQFAISRILPLLQQVVRSPSTDILTGGEGECL